MVQSHDSGPPIPSRVPRAVRPNARPRPNRPVRRAPFSTLLLLLPWILSSCVGPTDSIESRVWEGSLQPLGDTEFPITGSAAMVSGQVNTQIGISADGAEPETVLRWAVRRGDCSAEGEAIANEAVFPLIDVGFAGSGSADLVLGGRIPASQEYAAWVVPSDPDEPPLACGALVLRD